MFEANSLSQKIPHESRLAELPRERFSVGRKRREVNESALDGWIGGQRIERGDLAAVGQIPDAESELFVRCKSEKRGAIRGESVLAHFANIEVRSSRGDFVARLDIPSAHPEGACAGVFLGRTGVI
jgi:hypothetical protein